MIAFIAEKTVRAEVKIAKVAETLNEDDYTVDPEGCEDLTFMVPPGCCNLYTGANFQGDKYEICNYSDHTSWPS